MQDEEIKNRVQVATTQAAVAAIMTSIAERRAVVPTDDPNVVIVRDNDGDARVLNLKEETKPDPIRPLHRKGTSEHDRAVSFAAIVNRYKSPESALFAHASTAKIVAIFDYHEPGNEGVIDHNEDPKQATSKARRCEHRAVYTFPISDEWKAWDGVEGRVFKQADLARFLEDRIVDVVPVSMVPPGGATDTMIRRIGARPCDPSRLAEVARGLEVKADTKVANRVILETGEVRMVYETTHTGADGAPLDVPSAFVISIPVFDGGEPFFVIVRIRYRIAGGEVTWTLHPHGMRDVHRVAFDETVRAVADETLVPVFYGSPER